jgi:hypothetical protein
MVGDARISHLQLEITHYGISVGEYAIKVARIGPMFNLKSFP